MNTDSKQVFLNWSEAFEAGPKIVGGKGWNLGRLTRYGFKIPIGGALSTYAYEEFILENGLNETIIAISQTVTLDNVQEESSLEKFDQIRDKIRCGEIPFNIRDELMRTLQELNIFDSSLAVRSSASMEDSCTISFAGIHDSLLNISGLNNLISAIKECYASLWTPRAVAYRRKMNVQDEDMLLGVIIQEMIHAEAAGIGFSCDPRTGEDDVIVINANFGLGESVVGGLIQPDEYYLDNNPRLAKPTISSIKVGRKEGITLPKEEGGTNFSPTLELAAKQVLSDQKIEQLGLIILRIYDALGQGIDHQDVEWVYNGREFVLVQARPVTAIPKITYPELRGQPEIWSNGNFRDAGPMVYSTLGARMCKDIVDVVFSAYLTAVGYPLLPGLKNVRIFNGRAYANLSLLQWRHYDCFGLTPSSTNETMGGHQPEIRINEKGPYRGLRGLKRLSRFYKFVLALGKSKKNADKTFAAVDKYTRELRKKDFKNLPNQDFLKMFTEIMIARKDYMPTFAFMSGAATYPNQKLVDKLKKHFNSKGNSLATAVLAGGAHITSAQQGYRILELAQMVREDSAAKKFFSSQPFNPLNWGNALPDDSLFKKAFINFLDEFGHRGVYELEIFNPRWRENPSYLLDIIKNSTETADLKKLQEQQKSKADQAWEEISDKLPFYHKAIVHYWAKEAIKGAELREMSKSVLVKFFELLRLMFEEIGQRLQEKAILEQKSDVYHCALSELASILCDEWDGNSLKYLVAERKASKETLESLEPPDLIIDDVPSFAKSTYLGSGKVLTGLGVAAGNASGIAKLIYHPNEWAKLEAGNIMIAPSTDPGWTPLFLKASGIVMETGGFLSHGAIVAREYGIPSVVNIPGVMKIIRDGAEITVDGDNGQVIL
ncbi:MAG: PEP/pyruvate-binding domain-containing protein [Desulfosporosinus sp.]|nr:PEP/pyruvate-binding domain-containing protein [Desulfosporosinus sp.]